MSVHPAPIMTPEAVIRKIVDRDSRQRKGNGYLPCALLDERGHTRPCDRCSKDHPDVIATVEVRLDHNLWGASLYFCAPCAAQRVSDLAKLREFPAPYRCMGCGEAADLGIHGVGEDGEGRPFLATDCCGDMYIRPNGSIVEDDPRATEDW